MFDLIYSSIASPNIDQDDISDILKVSRDFNSKNGITGCLIYHRNQFAQLLEGDKKIVKKLYSKIEKDPRHLNVMLLAEGEKEERSFDHWSMAFYKLDLDNVIVFTNLIGDPSKAVRLFGNVAKILS